MHKYALPVGILAVAVGGAIAFGAMRGPSGPAVNPDPNHTHADFAVWVNGEKLDFSGGEFMSEAPVEGEPVQRQANPLRQYLHLHDGVGTVAHRHKPGLTVLDFLKSLDVTVRETEDERICLTFPQMEEEVCEADWHYFMLYTNDPTQGGASFLKDDYVFEDNDKILITNGSATTSEDVELMHEQWTQMSDDACLYSRLCPERGDPPAENCIADPEVPCVIPE